MEISKIYCIIRSRSPGVSVVSIFPTRRMRLSFLQRNTLLNVKPLWYFLYASLTFPQGKKDLSFSVRFTLWMRFVSIRQETNERGKELSSVSGHRGYGTKLPLCLLYLSHNFNFQP